MTIGVYKIELAGRAYVGSSSRSIEERWAAHVRELKKGRHHSPFLQSAFNKHGESALQFSILEAVGLPEQAVLVEQQWLDELHPEYNCCPVAGSCLGVKQSPETRAKIGAAHAGREHSPEHRARISTALKGREFSPEWLANMSAAQKGKTHLPETRAKIGAASASRVRSPETRAKTSASIKAWWQQRKQET